MTAKPRFSDILTETPSHQERVNQEMFRAIEVLGRKLQRAEQEREGFSEVLTQIEQASSRDARTGRLYLPALIEQPLPPPAPSARWQTALALTSSVIAICAVAVALQAQRAPQLTAAQLAALDALAQQQAVAPLVSPDLAVTGDAAALASAAAAPPPPPAAAQLADHPEEIAAIERDLTPAELSAIEPAAGDATAEIAAPTVTESALDAAPLPLAIDTARDFADAGRDAPAPQGKVSGIDHDARLSDAARKIEERAFTGAALAQHDLATLYAAGRDGAPQDYGRAIFWFEKSAENGVPNAQYNLGVLHQEGLGVEKDARAALGWYEKAAQLGHPQAMYNLGIAYVEGQGTEKNPARGVAFFKQAANAGIAEAAYNLGAVYESNLAGPADLARAEEWYETAANEGHDGAKAALARLSGAGFGQGDETAPGEETATRDAGADGEKPGLSPALVDSEKLVIRIQQALIMRGELPKAAETGELDTATADAIRSWQQTLGWDQTGEPTPELLDKIESSIRN